jgi:hypothetical protein
VHKTMKYWYRIVCLDTEDPVKQCYECEKVYYGVERETVRHWISICVEEATRV